MNVFTKIVRKIREFARHNVLKGSVESLFRLGIKADTPQRQLLTAYLGYTIIGLILLCMPFSQNGDISFIDNLFTVVSAVSTTGLSTVDVATQYTFFGQLVIIAIIQMGGLGYMTLSAYIMLKLTGHCSKKNAQLFHTQFAFPNTMDLRTMLRSTVNYTFLLEGIGFLLLCPYFLITGVEQPVWSALFHCISAFCTAGFSIYTDSLVRFQSDVYVNFVILALSIFGAMGFIMMTDIARKFSQKNYKITFTSKVILTITGGLALWSTVHLFFCEDSFQHLPLWDRFLVSLFQSVSAMTTVGYNTVDVSDFTHISLLVIALTMYIGASPSGTGGGLKSTTLSALYAYTICKLGLRKEVTLRGNVIPAFRVEIALTTIFAYTFLLIVGVYLMGLFEPNNTDFLELVFEASSALATAGLSSGVLSEITSGSKVVLILLMFIGRVGVVTFGNAVLAHPKDQIAEEKNDIAV